MLPFPHLYEVTARGTDGGDLTMAAHGAPDARVASPPEFGGPPGRWSPETLLVGAVATCFLLTFRAVAAASKLPWTTLDCHATGTLDRVERVTRFTTVTVQARLSVPHGTDHEVARRLLDKAERNCLITSSLNAAVHLDAIVETAADAAVARCA